jgi:peptidoglycan/xylan/chitin deacetylase (PgdA/CDA1 family)
VIPKYRDFILKIHEAGHEIASHGYSHENYCSMPERELFDEILRSKEIIEGEIGASPIGFRSPQFRTCDKLYNALSALDFRYDSSKIKTFFPSRYSEITTPSKPYYLDNKILEVPVSTIPSTMFPLGLRWINLIGKRAFVFFSEIRKPEMSILYLHPFDVISPTQTKKFRGVIKTWYSFKTKELLYLFEEIIEYWKRKNNQFIILRDLLKDKGKI